MRETFGRTLKNIRKNAIRASTTGTNRHAYVHQATAQYGLYCGSWYTLNSFLRRFNKITDENGHRYKYKQLARIGRVALKRGLMLDLESITKPINCLVRLHGHNETMPIYSDPRKWALIGLAPKSEMKRYIAIDRIKPLYCIGQQVTTYLSQNNSDLVLIQDLRKALDDLKDIL